MVRLGMYYKWTASLLFLLSAFQCAQRVGITGGTKDITPPRLIRSIPDTFSTNFNSDRIRLEFDEFVSLKQVNRNLLVTPVLRYDPLVVTSGKKVLIKRLDDSLWANTTYVMEFNESIQDITEKNPAKGFRYVFSTGNYVDSLQVNGQVKDAFTLKPLEDVYVFLYENDEDSLPYLEKPRYIGRSNKEGNFKIQNMKKGNYKVFMSTDDNKNYLFDMPGEKIDFLDSVITVPEDSGQLIEGHLYIEDDKNQFLEGYGMLNRWAFYLSFRRKVDTLFIDPWNDSIFPGKSFSRSYNAEGDSVVFWLVDSTKRRDKWNIYVKADTFARDTIELVFYEDKMPDKLGMKPNIKGGKLGLGRQLEYKFDYPVIYLDTGKIWLFRDSLEVPFRCELNASGRKLTFFTDWQENTKYRLIMDTAALTDINGLSNDSLTRSFSTHEINYYGTMEITLNGIEKEKGILMILDSKGMVVKQVYLENKTNHFFEFMEPGAYFLKYIVDENGNNRWDSGSYMEKRHAEPVFIYQGSIVIRSNWDQIIEWKFN